MVSYGWLWVVIVLWIVSLVALYFGMEMRINQVREEAWELADIERDSIELCQKEDLGRQEVVAIQLRNEVQELLAASPRPLVRFLSGGDIRFIWHGGLLILDVSSTGIFLRQPGVMLPWMFNATEPDPFDLRRRFQAALAELSQSEV